MNRKYRRLVQESNFTLKVEEYKTDRFPFCLYEDGKFLVSFATMREAQQKLEQLNFLYQEAIRYTKPDYVEEADEELDIDLEEGDDDLFSDAEGDEEVDLELEEDEAPAEEAPEEVVNENPDATATEGEVLEKEQKLNAINIANGFFVAAEQSGFIPEFLLDENLKADDNGAKIMREWAESVVTNNQQGELAGYVKLSPTTTSLVKGIDDWLNDIKEHSSEVLDVVMLKHKELIANKTDDTKTTLGGGEVVETTPEATEPVEGEVEGEGSEEAPAEAGGEEGGDLFGGGEEAPAAEPAATEEAPAEEEPAAEGEDLFA